MTVRRLLEKKRGDSLIEVLVAIAIFSIVFMLLFGSFSFAVKMTGYARETTVATNLAAQTIDQLRAKGFDYVNGLGANSITLLPQLPSGTMETQVATYAGNDKIRQVTIRIYWLNRPQNRAVTLTTLIGQGGIGG